MTLASSAQAHPPVRTAWGHPTASGALGTRTARREIRDLELTGG